MTTRDGVQATLRLFILKQFPAAGKSNLGDDHSLLQQGIVDSLGVLEIVTFIEEEFEVALTDEEMTSDHFESIASIADLIQRKRTLEDPAWIS